MDCGQYHELEFGDGVRRQKVLYVGWNSCLNKPQLYTESEMDPESGYYLETCNVAFESAYRWPGMSFLYLEDDAAYEKDDLWGGPLVCGWG
jgi:hypothetical protein